MNKCKLGKLLKVKHGFAFKSENYVEKSEYALVTLANISSTNDFQYNEEKTTYYGASFPSEFILKTGDLIMPLTEQVMGLFGNSAFVPYIKDTTFVLNQRVGKVLVDEEKADKFYIHYLLSTDSVRNQLEYRASGTRQRNISPEDVYDVEVFVPDLEEQRRIGKLLYALEQRVYNNKCINDNLAQMLRLLYEQWFYRFEFPNEQNLPYNRANGELEWNDKLKRRIPKGWKVQTMLSNELFSVISSGVDRFSTKKYYATADIIGSSIGEGSEIQYETRESRANMQPVINSVWFAKMKNSIKHLFLNKEMSSFIDSSILSTGFYGLKCREISFEYIASVVSAPIFEITKDRLSHGATQQGIGDDDMANITLLVPDKATLSKYHEATKGLYSQISNNILENKRLVAIRKFLLPLLMNGQATIAE